MRYDVPLIGREGHDPSILPDLLGVFRAAQAQGPLSYPRQAYFNSWILSGIFHHNDANTHLTLRKRPVMVRLAYEMMQYATSPEYFFDTESMDRRTLETMIQRQERMIGFFKRKLETAEWPIHKNALAIARMGELFNTFVERERESARHRMAACNEGKREITFAAGIAPFIPAHFAAHMMYQIGERMRTNLKTEKNAFMFRAFLPEARATIPFGDNSIHDVGERLTHDAVAFLRAINLRLQEALRAPDDGSYLPKNSAVERRLAEELFMFTKPYREPNLMPVKPAETPATVLSMDAFRAKQGRAAGHHPA